MIEADGLTKFYGRHPAIRDVSFTVGKGEILGFLGPNGAGKTTTMRILAGSVFPTAGSARIAGFDVIEESMAARQHIGYLPEIPPLYPEMSPQSYLSFVARVRGVRDHRKKVENVITACGLGEYRDALIGRLSKGYRQRVGLAQALVHDPDVLILDEPTIGLDPKQVAEIRALIRNLAGERTIILSTHVLPEVAMICTRVLIINKGRVIAEGTPQSLGAKLEALETVTIRVEEHSPAIADAINEVAGVISVAEEAEGQYRITCIKEQDIRAQIANLISSHGWGLLEMKLEVISLEDAFLRLVSDDIKEEE
jgi:ABC-2 type transport system ATP-binding protein